MKITAFDIEQFGLWSGLAVAKLSPGLNVFYGANEAGKSTLMEFVRAQLYGFGRERRRYARRPSNVHVPAGADVDHEGRSLYRVSGGNLELDCPSGQYKVRRMFQPDPTGGSEKVELHNLEGEKLGAQLLRVLLSGVDESTFNNVFAIGLDELQKLGSLGDTEAAEMLFRLSVGLDRVSIVDAIKEMTGRRNRLLDISEKENKPSLLIRLLQQREKIVEEIATAKLQIRDYVRLRGEQRIVDRNIAGLEDELKRFQRDKRTLEIARTAEPIWVRRDNVRRDIDGMGTVVVVSEETIARLESLGEQRENRRFAYDRLKEEYGKAREAIKAQPVNETLWKLAPRIEVLLEEEKRIVEIDGQITGLENEITNLEARIVDEEEQIKRGRRSLPLPTVANPASYSPVSGYSAPPLAEGGSENATATIEHASFTADGAVISASTTSPSIPVTAKGHRPALGSGDAISAEALEDYRVPARAVNKARHRLHRSKEQHSELSGRVKVLNEKVKSALQRHETKDLSEAVDQAARTVADLKRRQAIGARLAEMTMHHKELHRINAFLVQHQSLPPWGQAIIGLGCVLGGTMVGAAIFEALGGKIFEEPIPVLVPILGIVFIALSIGYKFVTEKSYAKKLEQNQRQLAMLLSQIEQAKKDAAAVDAKYPGAGSVSVELRCREAEQDLSNLEKLVPIDAQRREAQRQLKQVDLRQQRYKEEYAAATKRWSDWLRSSGLPADWTPARIRDLMDRCDVVGDLKKELDHRYELINQRIRDMRIITDRIDRMIVESGLSFEDGMSYVDILGEIRVKLEDNERAIRHRDKLKDGIRQFARMRKKAIADLHRARREEAELLRQFAVKTPEELRELHRRHLKHRRFLQQEQSIQRELDAAIGGFCEESVIGDWLVPRLAQKRLRQEAERELETGAELLDEQFDYDTEPRFRDEELPSLEELIQGLERRIEATSLKLHDELELRGSLGEQLKSMAEDRTTLRKQRELAVVDEKIARARSEWQTYAVCARMLDVIRSTYEQERQPKTLAEASLLLKQLTDGKYHRIWTPLGEETLLVDDDRGNTFDVAWLSRGAREQLFVSIRLALASAFAQHGSILPLILDDVLVNFDSRRSFAAAQLLLDFAKSGRQIFLFTCHEHVSRMFQKLDVPVRILPPVDDPGQAPKVLLPRSILRRRAARRRREEARLARERQQQALEAELARREETIRRDALRKAEVQRLILQMQQQATAEKAVEADRKALEPVEPQPYFDPPEEEPDNVESDDADAEEWWENEEGETEN